MSNRKRRRVHPYHQKQKGPLVNKSWPNWQNISGGTAYAYPDEYNRPQPSKLDLIRAVADMAYACISLIANNIALHRIKLYADMPKGRPTPKGCRTLTPKQRYHLKSRLDFTDLYQVERHPCLELLYSVNSEHNYLELMVNTVFSLEATGNAYWRKERDAFGVVDDLVWLPVEKVWPVKDRRTGVIVGYDYGEQSKPEHIAKEDVIHFRYPNLADAYGEGTSPLAAVWNRIQIAFKETGYLDATLTNNARPDAIISPDSDWAMGVNQEERLQKEITQRFRRAGAGGVLVWGDKLKLQPLSWQPKDLALAELYANVKLSISNAFHIPPDMWEPGASNRATAETAEYIFALRCLKPRIAYLTEKLTRDLAQEFDERLLFLADEIVPEDKTFELQKWDTLVKAGICTRATAQEMLGLPVEEWAREPLIPAGYLPPDAILSQVPPQPTDAEPEPVAEEDEQKTNLESASEIADLQRSYAKGELTREMCLANAVLIFGFTDGQAHALFPEIAAPATSPAPAAEPPAAPASPPTETPAPAEADAPSGDLSDEEVQKLGKQFMDELQQEWDAEEKGFKCGGEGGTPGPCPTAGTPAKGEAVHHEAESKAQKAVKLLKELPAQVAAKVKQKVADKYDQLQKRYGKAAAVTIMAAGIAGTLTPVPGGSLIAAAPVLGACELYLRLRGHKALEDVETKAVQGKTLPPLQLAEAGHLTNAVKKFLTRLSWEVEHSIKSSPDIATKAEPAWFDQDAALKDLMAEVFPSMEGLFHHGAKDTAKRLGDLSIFDVVNPHLKPALDRAVLEFAKSTLATTREDLDTARRMLREELHGGLEEGEAKNELMRRVQKVFNDATNERAFLIGTTEASRAQHAAELITAKESGVVKGKTWLADANACDICRELNGKTVGLDQPFMTHAAGGPYAVVDHAPSHPNCKCTQLLVV